MRIAYFGGSFDPPHLGHLRIARAALKRLKLDRIVLAPTGRQPLKQGMAAPFADRLAMVGLLVRGEEKLAASAVDAPQEGVPNYMVDTVARLRPTLPAGAKLFFLAGADSFLSLVHWRQAEALLDPGKLLDGWILAARPGFPLRELAGALPPGFRAAEPEPEPEPGAAGRLVRYTVEPGGMPLWVLPDLDDPAAATEIRRMLAAGEPAPALAPEVAAYIRENGLYPAVLR